MYIQLMKKPPKPNKKTRRKTRNLINEKLFKLNKEMKKKINHSLLCRR